MMSVIADKQYKPVFKYKVMPHELAKAKTMSILRILEGALRKQKQNKEVKHEAIREHQESLCRL